MSSIIITGGTSGIGRALARLCIKKGYKVGITGRREERLNSLKEELGENLFFRRMDVTQFEESRACLLELADEMGGLDILVLNAGVSNLQDTSSPETEQNVIDVNISGFVQLANLSYRYFEKRGRGHIVGLSSIASLLGYRHSAPYNASKAFVSKYLQGYRQKARRSEADIAVTEIIPGFVESEMTANNSMMFWVVPVDKAARQILRAIEKRRDYAYISKRWRLIAWIVKLAPNRVLNRL